MMKHEAKLFKGVKTAVPTTSRHSGRFLGMFFTKLLVLPVLAYQYFVAPLIAHCCRFHPCCSTYAQEAITKYGVMKGIGLGIKRLLRCHPWGGSGHDPVP